MLSYISSRTFAALFAVFIVSVLTFLFIHLIPGNPAIVLLGPDADEQDIAQMIDSLRLDRPLYVQYGVWLSHIVHGDLGKSILYSIPVLKLIGGRAETSMFLGFFSISLVLIIAIPLGVLTAVNRNSLVDQALSSVAMIAASMPTFWLGLNLILLFAVVLKWFPGSGFPSVFETGNLANIRFLVLPSITLGIPNAALVMRMTRSSMLDTLHQEYINTARAKGLHEMRVVLKHALRNAGLPIIGTLGFTFAGLMSGTVITESVFALPGVGKLVVDAVLRRDYPVIQGILLVIALLYILINFLTDLSYILIDPRVRVA